VITVLGGAPGPAGTDLAIAMMAPSPTPHRIGELRDWNRDAVRQARPAFDRRKQRPGSRGGERATRVVCAPR
jgi:hypothetical protein